MPNALRFFTCSALLFSSTFVNAQSCCEIKRDAGQKAFDKGDYTTAMLKWTEGKGCSDTECTDFSTLVAKAKEAAARVQEQEKLAAADDAYWEALKDGDIADCDKYLARYPAGKNAAAAAQRKKDLTGTIATTPSNAGKPYRDCPACPIMVPIEGGTYTMGDAKGEANECPHTETVASFSLGQYEVTVEEYLRFADATKSHYPEWLEKGNNYHVETGSDKYYAAKGYSRTARSLPICGVSWDDAVAYCAWLSKETGKKYRLPLEKEWEYAAKGGKKTRSYQYAGSNNADEVAWHNGNSGAKPHAVGGKAANELGLYDMSGNLWEWCQDNWGAYPGCTADKCDGCAVLRGGSWYDYDTNCRSANRYWFRTFIRSGDYGFRCARDGQ